MHYISLAKQKPIHHYITLIVLYFKITSFVSAMPQCAEDPDLEAT